MLKTAVLAPIPRARVKLATVLKPGDLCNMRKPKRASSYKSCSHRHPQVSRVTSFTNSTFPNSLRAARCASPFFSPRSARSCAAISRWLRTSSSSSFSCFRLPKSPLSHLIRDSFSNSQFLLSIFKFLFVPQCAQGVHPRGPPCGNITAKNRHHQEQERKDEQKTRVSL